jgi:biopolymer transport protein TolQ
MNRTVKILVWLGEERFHGRVAALGLVGDAGGQTLPDPPGFDRAIRIPGPSGISVERPGKGANVHDTTIMAESFLVPPVLATANVIQIFIRADIVGQVITTGLAVFSLIAWTIMLGKHYELKRLHRLNRAFEGHLRDQRSLLDLPESYRHRRSIPYADVFADALEGYWRAAAIGTERGEDSSRARLEHAENAIQRALARQTLRYESSMVFLASIVTGAPFLGLLGTVWGVMVAFSQVAVQQTASISSLAPGISAALLTTIAGLLVAIPSLFGYNFLFASTKHLITEMENFASSLADRLELESK